MHPSILINVNRNDNVYMSDLRITYDSILTKLDIEDKKAGLQPVKKIGINNTDFQGRTCRFNLNRYYIYKKFMVYCKETNSLTITLTEIYRKKQPEKNRGNPNLIYGIIMTPKTISHCRSQDFHSHNRSYVISCPLREKHFNITLSGQLPELTYSGMNCTHDRKTVFLKIYQDSLHDKSLLHLNRTKTILYTINKTLKKCIGEAKPKTFHNPRFWLRIDDQWHWYVNNCYYPYYLEKMQEDCIKKLNIVHVGDSHARYRVFQLRSSYNLSISSNDYLPSSTSLHLVCWLRYLIKMVDKGKIIDWLILNTGHHDQATGDPIRHVAYMYEAFNLIKRLKMMVGGPKILWIEATPTENRISTRGMLNNLLTRAWNDWIGHELSKIDVSVVRAFEMASSFPGQTTDGIHHRTEFGHSKITGGLSIGGAIISVLLGMIC